MSVLSVQSQKQSVHESKRAFSLILSALFLTVVMGSSAISLAQDEVKATAKDNGGAATCSSAEDHEAGAGKCTQPTDEENSSKLAGASPQASAITIFSNLGKGAKAFDQNAGLPVGPGSGSSTQAVGIPFTPAANINLEGMELPIGWHSGLNSVYVCVYTDIGGFPGISVQCTLVYNMYPFGKGFPYYNCIWEWPRPFYPWPCICYNVWGWNPFPLFAGTRYWVVVFPDYNEPDFWGYWYENYKHVQGPVAVMDTTGTWQVGTGIQPALAVYGK